MMNFTSCKCFCIRLILLFGIAVSGNAVAQQKKVVVVPLLGGDVSTSDFSALQAQVQALQQRVPFSYGRISSSGSILDEASTDNFSATYNAALGRYEIDFDDVSFNINRDIALATLTGTSSSCPAGAGVRVGSVGGNLLVYVEASNGANLQCSFTFTAYDS